MLLSIDPGVNNCGVAVIDYTGNFTVLKTYNITNARKLTQTEKEQELTYGLRSVKVLHITEQVKQILKEYQAVDHVAIEAPFYSVLTPMAYGSLLEVISAIKYAVLLPLGITFSMTEPLLVKRMFINVKLSKDTKKKDAMRAFLIKKVDAKEIVLDVQVDSLSEHEIDAIAVGYTRALTEILKQDAQVIPAAAAK